jgi:hypothetical protein
MSDHSKEPSVASIVAGGAAVVAVMAVNVWLALGDSVARDVTAISLCCLLAVLLTGQTATRYAERHQVRSRIERERTAQRRRGDNPWEWDMEPEPSYPYWPDPDPVATQPIPLEPRGPGDRLTLIKAGPGLYGWPTEPPTEVINLDRG